MLALFQTPLSRATRKVAFLPSPSFASSWPPAYFITPHPALLPGNKHCPLLMFRGFALLANEPLHYWILLFGYMELDHPPLIGWHLRTTQHTQGAKDG